MLRDNDIGVSKQEELTCGSNFDNNQWGGLSQNLDSKFPNQESMTNMLFVDRLQHGHVAGSGMIGNPSFVNSGSSSSSSINEYAGNFFGDSYAMYEGYPTHFTGASTMHQQSHHNPSLLPYGEQDHSTHFKTEIFDGSHFNNSQFDQSRKEKSHNEQNDMGSSSISLVPPSASSPAEANDHDSFSSIPSGGMGGFVGNWGYEGNSGSLPLSMMHSPLRGQQMQPGFTMVMPHDSNAPPPQFLPPGFQFTSQFYTQPQLHESESSNFTMTDPSTFMMFYPSGDLGGRRNESETSTTSATNNASEKRRSSATSTNRASRTGRGQIMVLKDSGDMIAEPDDEASDSPFRSSVPRRYMCSVCSKRFTRPSTLRTHMNSHTGERPYHCPSSGCDWKFTVLSNLKRHMRICAGVKRVEGLGGNVEADNEDWRP